MEKFDPGMEKAVKMAATFTEIDLLISTIGLKQHMVKRAVKFRVLAFLETNPQQKNLSMKNIRKKKSSEEKNVQRPDSGVSEIRGIFQPEFPNPGRKAGVPTSKPWGPEIFSQTSCWFLLAPQVLRKNL